MAGDLLSTIAAEIEARLAELRPLNDEYEQLLVAADALESERRAATPEPAPKAKRAPAKTKRAPARARRTPAKATRAARGAARGAILAALDHGSHTVSELTLVTAMKAPNVSGNLRRLLDEGAVAKVDRDGKTAYALADNA